MIPCFGSGHTACMTPVIHYPSRKPPDVPDSVIVERHDGTTLLRWFAVDGFLSYCCREVVKDTKSHKVLKIAFYNSSGRLHRADDLPALIVVGENDVSREWHSDGVLVKKQDDSVSTETHVLVKKQDDSVSTKTPPPPPTCGTALPPPTCGTALPPPACGTALPPPTCGTALPPPACGTALPPPACGTGSRDDGINRIQHASWTLFARISEPRINLVKYAHVGATAAAAIAVAGSKDRFMFTPDKY